MLLPFLSFASVPEIEAMLEEYITDVRKAKIATILSQRLSSIHVACEAPSDIHNALAIVRTGEALGVTNIHIIDSEMRRHEGRETMKGAGSWSFVQFYKTLPDFLSAMDVPCLGIDPYAEQSISEIEVDSPFCLLFGNEKRGLSEEAKKACLSLYRIPMFGMTESYNLSVSAAITLYDVTKRKRKVLEKQGDIKEKEKQMATVRAYIRTLGQENALRIVKTKAK